MIQKPYNIMNQSKKSIALAAAAIMGMSMFAVESNAQGRHGYGHGHYPIAAPQNAYILRQIEQNVCLIDRLSDQMYRQYAVEARRHCGCRHTQALLGNMRRHTILADNLVRASRGSCAVTFKKAACAVREKLNCIQRLARYAPVSPCTMSLIHQSCPPSTFVHNNANQWIPAAMRSNPRNSHHHYTSRQPSGYSNPLAFFLSQFGF